MVGFVSMEAGGFDGRTEDCTLELAILQPDMKKGDRHPFPGPEIGVCPQIEKCGSVLLSHPLSRAVPSALEGLTSVFGMGTGMAPPPSPPQFLYLYSVVLPEPSPRPYNSLVRHLGTQNRAGAPDLR